jgi:proline dehydrogenase
VPGTGTCLIQPQQRGIRIAPPVAILDRAIVRFLPAVPKPVVRRISERYIAGSELGDATRAVQKLNAQGKLATIDVLGEEITNEEETRVIARAYEDVLAEIDRAKLDSNISVKLTGLGLELDYDLCYRNLERVVREARERGHFVRIDMEDSTTTDATLRLYRALREGGFDNVGVVLQASLRRTVDDVDALADLRPSVRVCKGIYIESPSIQFRDYEAVRANFVLAVERLLEAGCYVAVATHDAWLIDDAKRRFADRGLARDEYEFQMLLGVRPDLGDELVREGHKLRIYVPFGAYWYQYSLRRLQENPAIASYIAGDTFSRLLHRNGR